MTNYTQLVASLFFHLYDTSREKEKPDTCMKTPIINVLVRMMPQLLYPSLVACLGWKLYSWVSWP